MAVITAVSQDEPEQVPVGTVVRSRTPTLEEILASPRYTPAQLDRLSWDLAIAFDELGLAFEPHRIDRRRLDAALNKIGHQGSPTFRLRLAAAYDATPSCSLADAVDRVNCAIGDVALTLEPSDPRRQASDHVQDGLDMLHAEVAR